MKIVYETGSYEVTPKPGMVGENNGLLFLITSIEDFETYSDINVMYLDGYETDQLTVYTDELSEIALYEAELHIKEVSP
jgi:hypothetical protein